MLRADLSESTRGAMLRAPHGRFTASLLFCILIALCSGITACRAATNDSFAQGTAAYRAGQFVEATDAFENAAAQHPGSGTLVNLGLAEWRRGHAGPAILSWERARWVAPFDARAAENLRFARQAVQVDAPQLKWFEAVSTWLPANAWLWLASGGLWLAVGMLLLPGVFNWRKRGWHQALAAGGLCLFLLSLTANVGVINRTNIGFVVEKNAHLLLTPTRTSEVTSTLTAGEAARRLRTQRNYYLIRTEYGTGWIERDQFELVVP